MFFLSGLLGLLLGSATVGLVAAEDDEHDESAGDASTSEPSAASGSGGLLDNVGRMLSQSNDVTAVPEEAAAEAEAQDDEYDYDEDTNLSDALSGTGAFADLGDAADPFEIATTVTTTTTAPGFDVETRIPSDPATDDDDILWGTLDDDSIDGGAGDDQINGYDGDDVLSGGAGGDSLLGGEGDDTLGGGADDDRLDGDTGADVLSGAEGDDTLWGGMGDDVLHGEDGRDILIGGAGADSLDGGTGDDTLEGNNGDDILTGGLGADELFGGKGNDLIVGLVPDGESGNTDLDGTDYLNGGEGADTLMTGSGDWASGGEGGDLFALGEWIDPDEPATITDYEAASDQIAVVYDPDAGVAPELTLEPSEQTDGAVWVVLNGVKLAEVLDAEDLRPEDILLVTPAEFAYL